MDITETYRVTIPESTGISFKTVEVPVHIADEDVEDYIAGVLQENHGI